MQIAAVLAVLGATLGQPDDPPDQDMPAAEQQEPDADSQPAEEQREQAGPSTAEQQQQQADSDSSPAGEQPAETGSDDGSAGLDEATSWRLGYTAWQQAMRRLYEEFVNGPLRTYGPFIIRFVNIRSRQPAVDVTVAVQGRRTLEQLGAVDEQVRTWICETEGREFMGFGGVIVMHLTDDAGASRTVTLTGC